MDKEIEQLVKTMSLWQLGAVELLLNDPDNVPKLQAAAADRKQQVLAAKQAERKAAPPRLSRVPGQNNG